MLLNKIALVTGGSRGIGREIAVLLAREGAFVYVNYRESARQAAEVVAAIKKAEGRAVAIQGDVSDEKDVEHMFRTIREKHGTLDILVNNAGILKNNLLSLTPTSEFDTIMATNCRGVFLCTRAACKPMMLQRSGKIITISSISGVQGNRGQSAYAASKAAILGFTKSVAKEVGGFGITVNAIAPGFIATEMTTALPKKIRDHIVSTIALGRIGMPSDVAKVALFLASPLADYVTGQVLGVDGGQIL